MTRWLVVLVLIGSLLCASWTSIDALNSQTLTVMAVTGIDGKTVGNTTLFTNDHPSAFYPIAVHIVLTTVSGLGTPPVVNVGKTAATYADVVNGFALTALTAANTMIAPTLVAGGSRIASGESLVVRVATGAVATTTYTFDVVVVGYVR